MGICGQKLADLLRNRLRNANCYHPSLGQSTVFARAASAILITLRNSLYPVAKMPSFLRPVECLELALQLFELLARLAKFSSRGQALIVFEVLCRTLDKRIDALRGLR